MHVVVEIDGKKRLAMLYGGNGVRRSKRDPKIRHNWKPYSII
jgi:hypothetical protein